MLTLTSGLSQLRPHFTDENRDLFRVLLNATSAAEASLALQVLSDSVPSRALVTTCNLREVLHALPVSPFTMRVDEQLLIRTAGLEKHGATLSKTLPDGIELVVTTAGNLVLDIIVKHDAEKYFWTPIPVVDDFVNPCVVDLVVTSGYLLDELIELVKCMGVVFNPKFYLSLEDFTLEYAADAMAGMQELFYADSLETIRQPTEDSSSIARVISPPVSSTPRQASSASATSNPNSRASSAEYFTQ